MTYNINNNNFHPNPINNKIASGESLERAYFNLINDNNFWLCPCRGFTASAREYLFDEPLIEKIENIFADKKELIVYSLGSGQCKHEITLSYRLAEKNYAIDRFVLIDSLYPPSDFVRQVGCPSNHEKSLASFKNIFTQIFPRGKVSTYSYNDQYVADLKNSVVQYPDVVMAVHLANTMSLSERKKEFDPFFLNSPKTSLLGIFDAISDSKNGILIEKYAPESTESETLYKDEYDIRDRNF